MKRATLLLAFTLGASAPGGEVKDLPVNRWTKLPVKEESGYMWSQPLYVPTRGQVLHWGCIGTVKARLRNDVRAFDAAAGDWVSDYPLAPKLPSPPTTHGRSKGVGYKGVGEMLACGTPAPSFIANGVSWDSKRKQLIYTMRGLMAAYDPETRKWRDMKAKTIIDGKELPGGPPVYGAGTGYDPVNDEIVMFPHYGAVNRDMVPVTGRVYGHLGTLRYSFEDNTWRRAGDTFGSEDLRKGRKAVIGMMGRVSGALDALYAARGRIRKPSKVIDELAAASSEAEAAEVPAEVKGPLKETVALLRDAMTKALMQGPRKGIAPGAEALRRMEALLEGPLRLEPPMRCATPLVYDPGNKCLVMFGGHDGLVRTDLKQMGRDPTPPGLNDTWVYDARTRQWRELACKTRPPLTRLPRLFYDPASELVLLVTRTRTRKQVKMTVWALEVARAEWTRRHEEVWSGRAAYWWTAALDEKSKAIILTQVDQQTWPQCVKGQETWALRLDAGKMAPTPAPPFAPPPPMEPHAAPKDDPAWLARLKGLPANKWVHVKPERDADTRDWGNAACDPLRGHLYYFGGGHSTYQVNDVAVFNPGAGRWSFAAGDHNDWVPPAHWGGCCMGLRGGSNAHHMRNSYAALDGRMYKSVGCSSRRWGAETAKLPGARWCHFYDLDRGGVWRQREVKVEKGEGVAGTWGAVHMATPDGRVIGFGGTLEPYDGRFFAGEVYFNVYDAYANKLTVKKVPPPLPGHVYEVRPFCYVADRDAVLFYEYVGEKGKVQRQRTWLYDIKTNTFNDMKPARQPPGEANTVVYLDGQKAAFAVVNRGAQWVYSLERNTWAELPLASDAKIGFAGPYAQLVYSAKYGVLVNTGGASRGVAVMRPNVSKVKW